jgi:hypothetical protein
MHRKNRVFPWVWRVTGSGSGSWGFGVRLGCTHRSRAHRKPLLGPPNMEDRTSGRIGSHGFSWIRRVWLAGPSSWVRWFPRPRHHRSRPTGSIGRKLSHWRSLGSAPSLPISDSPSPNLSVSLFLSSLNLSMSLSLSVGLARRKTEEEMKKEERRNRKMRREVREIFRGREVYFIKI